MSYNVLFNEALKCFDAGDFDRAEFVSLDTL